MDLSLIQLIGSLGVGGVLALIIFLMYRQEKKSTEDRIRQDRMFMEDTLREIIKGDQDSRGELTKIMIEMVTLLRRLNGHS